MPSAGPGSVSNAEAWEAHRRAYGRPHQQDRPIPFPPGSDRVVQAFFDLSRQRGNNGWSPERLNWRDIEAWCRLTGTELGPLERDLVQDLDDIWMQVWSEANAPDPPDNKNTHNRGRR